MENNTSIDDSAAIEFLELFRPGGPWTLAAKTPRGFVCETTDTPAEWLSNHIGDQYFLPATPRRRVSKKPGKDGIANTEWLWVDIDPRAGEDLAAERERILALLTTNLPDGVPRPTFVIDSGRGFWGFWQLADAVGIEAEEYNRGLELAFDADACHNIDRVARLPGTVNSKTGEVAAVVEQHTDRVYPLSSFSAAPQTQTKNPETVTLSEDTQRLADIDALNQWNVPDRVKTIIVQGHDPDNPKDGDDSRSAWLFDALCQLYRSEVPDDVIYGIITDPNLGISASVVDKGGSAEKYALRQMTRAKEHAIDPMLAELNQRHAVIANIGGRVRVMDQRYEDLKFQSFEDFRNRYSNRFVEIGTPEKPSLKPAGKWWLDHPRRRQYERVIFTPGDDVAADVHNLWSGFAVEPIPGDCDLLMAHIRHNICDSDQLHFGYLLRWMARGVQRLDAQGEIAVVLRGGQGTGKSFFAKAYGSLFGRHFRQVSDPRHLVGNFNAHLQDCCVLLGDEAFFAGDKRHESVLKTLITEETLNIERKGYDIEQCRNHIRLILASNNAWVVPADIDDRRFFVLDVANTYAQDTEYFGAIARQLNSGGREALLHHLLAIDLQYFDVRARPASKALDAQKEYSLTGVHKLLYAMLQSGEAPALAVDDDRVLVRAADVATMFRQIKTNPTALGRALGAISSDGNSVRHTVDGKQQRGYWLPGLASVRQAWAEDQGLNIRWPDDDGHWAEVDVPEGPY